MGNNWWEKHVRAQSEQLLMNRRMPFAPLNVDKSYLEKDEFMRIVGELEGLSMIAANKQGFAEALALLKKNFLGAFENNGRPGEPRAMDRTLPSDQLERFDRYIHP